MMAPIQKTTFLISNRGMNDQVELDDFSSTSYSPTKSNVSDSHSASISTNQSNSSSSSNIDEKISSEKNSETYEEVGYWGNLLNLLNCMLGAGILSVPSTFNDSGIIVSLVIMIIVVLITHYATVITLILQGKTKASGIDELTEIYLGKVGSFLLSVMVIIFNVGACLAYLVLGVDFIVSWFSFAGIDVSSSLYRAIITFVYGLCIPILLSVPKSLRFLSYLSSITDFFIVFYFFAMLAKMIIGIRESGISDTICYAKADMKLFSSISIYATSFALPICILPIIWSFTPNVKKRCQSSYVSLAIVFALTAIPSIFVYIIFGENTEGNVLKNFKDDDILIVLVRIGFFLIVTMSYPVVTPCISASWSSIIFKVNNAADLTGWRRALILVITNGVTLIIAMFLPEMKPALEVGGAIGGCLGNFTVPGLLWIVASTKQKTHWTNILSMFLTAFGVITAVISTYTAVLSAIDAFKTVDF
ncbi:Transmembrane amino acid transporter protein [Tritrichomonas foetus]|uniref:Transmembrane amino acid transporter protein n=1 Tax=Tritrichomonas foetus TaxID=1144522 RepID=A0A1J4JSB5_9EUKA|nr:Transmembrane amino acid transporter protein [Tritrichomonas foetus]|eukprot:OHT02031.1 Transmembrane amino acid transporter protein [Tritrichomonas foetus]